MNKLIFLSCGLAFIALALLVGYYAQSDTHQSFTQGSRSEALVTYVGQKSISVRGVDENGQMLSAHDSDSLRPTSLQHFHVGDKIRIAHHTDNPARIMPESALDDLKPSRAYLNTIKTVAAGSILSLLLAIVQNIRRKRLKTGWDVMLWSLARTRNMNLGIGALLSSFGGFIFWLVLFDAQNKSDPLLYRVPLVLLGGVSVFVGLWALWRGLSLINLKKSPLYAKLTMRSAEIVWIYEMQAFVRHIQLGKERYVMVGFLDGSLEQIAVEKNHVPLVIQSISQMAPQARVGYSPEMSDMFKTNPILMVVNREL